MNIRKRVISTTVHGSYETLDVPTIFGGEKEKRIWVPAVSKRDEILEYLDPTDAKWKPIPTVTEYVYLNR